MNFSESPPAPPRLLRNAGVVTVFTLLSRVLGAARDLVIAHFFGAGLATDAFVQAFTIPNVLRRLTAEGAITQAFVPLYTEIRKKEGPSAAGLFASRSLGLALICASGLTGLGMVFAPELVYLFAAGFKDDPGKFQLTVDLTRMMFPYLLLVTLVAWAMGVLNARSRFATPAAAPMLLNLGIIGSAVAISPVLETPIYGIAIGVLLGGSLQVLLQVPALRAISQSLKPAKFWGNPEIHRLLKLLGPTIFGAGVYQINIVVLRNLASFLPEGQVTHYYNSSRLTELALGVFVFGIASATLPELSRHTAGKDWERMRNTLRFSMAATLVLVVPASFGLIAMADPIVAMLYFHGEYSWEDVRSTSVTLQAFALGIPAVAVIRMQTLAFYAMKNTRTPVLIAAVSVPFTGVLGWYWSGIWDVRGLALGLTAGTLFQALLLSFQLKRNPQASLNWWPGRTTGKTLFASLVMGGFAWTMTSSGQWNRGPFDWENWVLFIGTMMTAALLYGFLLWLMKEEMLRNWITERTANRT